MSRRHPPTLNNVAGADDVSAEEINIVVAHIKRLARRASLEFALNAGSVIIHHFYAGDTGAWRSRGPKTASFRRLAEHPELPLSPGSLYRCVALFELCERLNAPSRWEHLGASHLRVVLGLPAQVQETLLATANNERWTVRTLQREVLLRKSMRQTRGGRRAQPALTKSLLSIKRSLQIYRDAVDDIAQLSQQEAEHGLQLLEEATSGLELLRSELRMAISTTDANT